MSTKIVQEGETIKYANTSTAIIAGTPVKVGSVSAILGIAATDIAATTGVGTLNVGCVVILPKASGAVYAQGDQVYWDVSAGNIDDNAMTPASGDFPCGTAWVAGANGETTGTIKLHDDAHTCT